MFVDARTVPDGSLVEADVCIIGAGAAGITIARELRGRSLRVVLLESGWLTPDQVTQSLYAGSTLEQPYFPLETARTRYFGGTTNEWSGECRPLDALDFEKRDLVEEDPPRIAPPSWRSLLKTLRQGRLPAAALAHLQAGIGRIGRAAATRMNRAHRDPSAYLYLVKNVMEQAPNPESRVVLGRDRDELGCPRVELRWRLCALDKRTAHRAHQILAEDLERSGIGSLRSALGREDDPWPPTLRGARHHMGTTRMHPDPRRGVVDADARVHGIANLYVAGSSVFPTSGSANPTLTIVALALRLAEHTRQRL